MEFWMEFVYIYIYIYIYIYMFVLFNTNTWNLLSWDCQEEGRKTLLILGFILLIWPVFQHFSDLRKNVFYKKKIVCFTMRLYALSQVCLNVYMTVIEGDLKAPFSRAITLRYMGGRYTFPWIAQLYPYVPYNAVLSKEASSTISWVFGSTRPGMELWSPGPL